MLPAPQTTPRRRGEHTSPPDPPSSSSSSSAMSVHITRCTSDTMDFMEHGYLHAPSPCDYTFNFWTDYLGLSTLVAQNKVHAPPFSPNSITESLKASLGLEDDSPVCPCVIARGRDAEGHVDCCSIYDLQERISLLGPYDHLPGDRGGLPGLELLSAERRRKQSARGKPEPRVCVFCRNNGAPEEVYGTHILKTPDGRVLCPILRAYTCPLCSANGDNAHTIKYCPLSREQPGGQRLLRGGPGAPGARTPGKRLKSF